MLTPAKHQYDVLHLAFGVDADMLERTLDEHDVGINLHNEPYPSFENRVCLHLAAGHLVLSEPLSPTHGLEPAIDYLVVTGAGDIVAAIDAMRRFPGVYHRVRVRGRRKAEGFRASHVYPAAHARPARRRGDRRDRPAGGYSASAIRGAVRLKRRKPAAITATAIASGISSSAGSPIASAARRVAGRDQRVARLLEDRRERVAHQQRGQRLVLLDHDVDRIEDRRGVEEHLEHDVPDRPHVAQRHVEAGEQQAEAGREAPRARRCRNGSSSHDQRTSAPAANRKTNTTSMFSAGVEQRGQHRGHRDRRAAGSRSCGSRLSRSTRLVSAPDVASLRNE